jgi:hypothetical protein
MDKGNEVVSFRSSDLHLGYVATITYYPQPSDPFWNADIPYSVWARGMAFRRSQPLDHRLYDERQESHMQAASQRRRVAW